MLLFPPPQAAVSQGTLHLNKGPTPPDYRVPRKALSIPGGCAILTHFLPTLNGYYQTCGHAQWHSYWLSPGPQLMFRPGLYKKY